MYVLRLKDVWPEHLIWFMHTEDLGGNIKHLRPIRINSHGESLSFNPPVSFGPNSIFRDRSNFSVCNYKGADTEIIFVISRSYRPITVKSVRFFPISRVRGKSQKKNNH